MRRSHVLPALLAAAVLAWGGLNWQSSRHRAWLAGASRAELQGYVAAHGDDAAALTRLSLLTLRAGDRAEAERLARRAVQSAPNEEEAWVAFSRAASDEHEAIDGLNGYLKTNPERAPILAELARHTLRMGDAGAAPALAERALKASPASPEAWQARGEILAAERRLAEAADCYRKSLAARDDAETRLALARTLIPLQRYAEIVELCRPLLGVSDGSLSPELRARALVYFAGSRLYDPLDAAAIDDLQRQLREADSLSDRLAPEERFLAPYFLGESYLRQGKPREAIPLLERSVAAGSMFAGNRYALARAYRMAGERDKADTAARQHIRISKNLSDLEMYSHRLEERADDADAMLHLADALADTGSMEQARALYERLITQGKHTGEAKRKLNTLNQR